MAERRYAALYREHLRSMLPVSGGNGKGLMAVKQLYDCDVFFPKNFELVMLKTIPTPSAAMPVDSSMDDSERQYVFKKRQERLRWGEAMLALRRMSSPTDAR